LIIHFINVKWYFHGGKFNVTGITISKGLRIYEMHSLYFYTGIFLSKGERYLCAPSLELQYRDIPYPSPAATPSPRGKAKKPARKRDSCANDCPKATGNSPPCGLFTSMFSLVVALHPEALGGSSSGKNGV